MAPDGSWLANTGDDGEADLGSSRHTRAVSALGVTPDGSWLVSTDDGGEMRVWDPSTGAALTSLRVADDLFHLLLTSTTIAAAGHRGLYLLTLRRDSLSGQPP